MSIKFVAIDTKGISAAFSDVLTALVINCVVLSRMDTQVSSNSVVRVVRATRAVSALTG